MGRLRIFLSLVVMLNLVVGLKIKLYTDRYTGKRAKRTPMAVELCEDLHHYFYGGISVGYVPQPFNAIFDTASDLTWVPKSKGKWSEHHEYVESMSSTKYPTILPFLKDYTSHRVSGKLMHENISIGDIAVGRMLIGLAHDAEIHQSMYGQRLPPAVVGLTYKSETPHVTTLLEVLHGNRKISNQVFTLSFQRMRVGGGFVFQEKQKILLDSAHPHVYGPESLVLRLNRMLGCTSGDPGASVVSVDHTLETPLLTIQFNDFQLSLTPRDYVFKKTNEAGAQCESIFRTWPHKQEEFWRFGTLFMKKYCITFDKRYKQISFVEVPC